MESSLGGRNASPTAILSGASGFVGTAVAQALRRSGYRVAPVVRQGSRLPSLLKSDFVVPADEFGGIDVPGSVETLRADVVIHTATHYRASHTQGDVARMIDANLRLATQLAEVAAACRSTFVDVRSTWQLGDGRRHSLYSATKAAFESILDFYVERADLRLHALYLSDTYGQEDPRGKLITQLMQAAWSGDEIRMTSGDQLIAPLWVEDAAAAVCALLNDSVTAGSYQAIGREVLRVRDLVNRVESASGSTIRVKRGPIAPLNMDKCLTVASQLPQPPLWMPKTSLDAGLASAWTAFIRETTRSVTQ